MRLVQMVAPQALGSFYLGLYDFSKFEGQKKRVAYRVYRLAYESAVHVSQKSICTALSSTQNGNGVTAGNRRA